MKREPAHFTINDFYRALFGSFIVSLSFLFNGAILTYARKLETPNIIAILLITLIILSIEIYLLSYKFVIDRKKRPFYEFWTKRFFAISISSFISIYLLIFLYGLNNAFSHIEILKISIAILLPATTVGAAMEVLKKHKGL